jgi:hypothetical protein
MSFRNLQVDKNMFASSRYPELSDRAPLSSLKRRAMALLPFLFVFSAAVFAQDGGDRVIARQQAQLVELRQSQKLAEQSYMAGPSDPCVRHNPPKQTVPSAPCQNDHRAESNQRQN